MTATPQAIAAVRAAKNVRTWGAYAALVYAEKRGAIKHFEQAFYFEQRRQATRRIRRPA